MGSPLKLLSRHLAALYVLPAFVEITRAVTGPVYVSELALDCRSGLPCAVTLAA
jgi:hypothetical protein